MKCQQGKISYVLFTSWFLSSFIFYHFGRFPSQAFVKCLFIQVSFSEFRAELLILSTDLYFSRSAEHVYRYFAVFLFFFLLLSMRKLISGHIVIPWYWTHNYDVTEFMNQRFSRLGYWHGQGNENNLPRWLNNRFSSKSPWSTSI